MRRYVFRLAILTLAALGSSVARADDQQIAQQIIEKLQAEKLAGTLKGFSIDLQVDEGTVWLSGRVASEEQQARALDLARRVTGVQQVVNDLSITAPATKPAVAKPTLVKPIPTPNPLPAAPTIDPYRELEIPAAQTHVAATPAPAPAAAPALAKKPVSPAQNSMLNSVSKSLMKAVHGGPQPETAHSTHASPTPASASPAATAPAVSVQAVPLHAVPTPAASASAVPVHSASQPVFASKEVAAATGSGPIGSGVDSTTASTRRSVVQAAQPVANVPQQVTTADSLQPLNAAAAPAPQMAAMVPMQVPYMVPVYAGSQMQVPLAMGAARPVAYMGGGQMAGPHMGGAGGAPVPMYMPGSGVGIAPARYDHPTMPGYAWPSYAAYPNYAAVTYPKQYSPTAWPYIGPFYPYPQVPLGWRKVTLEWDDGWWMLDFKDRRTMYNH